MTYELWDIESGNLVGAYETEAEALATVREVIDLRDLSYADALALVRDDDQPDIETIAVGAALVARAQSMHVADAAEAFRV
jgi:hypothetical protein